MGRPSLEIALESKEAFAGDFIKGLLAVSTEEEVVASDVRVLLEGEERTRIRSSRPGFGRLIFPSTGYTGERTDIPGVEDVIMAERRIEPPGARIPFNLRVPVDALPSYSGRFSHIRWVLKARMGVDPPPDLFQMAEVTVLSRAEDLEGRVAVTPEGAAVGLRLEVEGGRVAPRAHVTGGITIGEVNRRAREIRVEMVAHEVARARSRGWQEIEVEDRLLLKQRVFGKEEMVVGARKPFDLEAPSGLPPMYRGEASSVDILLRAVADMRLRPNVSIAISLRGGSIDRSP